MGKPILRNYESFDEIPEGFLQVKQNCNLMYVRIGKFAFVAREFFDNIIVENDVVKCIVSYCNVKNNKQILNIEFQKALLTNEIIISNKNNDVEITPLSKILNIKGNGVYFLSMKDIEGITGFRPEYVKGKKTSII